MLTSCSHVCTHTHAQTRVVFSRKRRRSAHHYIKKNMGERTQHKYNTHPNTTHSHTQLNTADPAHLSWLKGDPHRPKKTNLLGGGLTRGITLEPLPRSTVGVPHQPWLKPQQYLEPLHQKHDDCDGSKESKPPA